MNNRFSIEFGTRKFIGHLKTILKLYFRISGKRDCLKGRGEGREVAASLVHALVQTYLADNASTDPISARLRTLCPALYTMEDSTSSKVHELLLAAGQQSKAGERERIVGEAVTLALGIASRLQLPTVVSHLAACQAYTR